MRVRTKRFGGSVVRFFVLLDKKREELRLLRDDCGLNSDELEKVWTEADELIRIFVTMSKNTKQRNQG